MLFRFFRPAGLVLALMIVLAGWQARAVSLPTPSALASPEVADHILVRKYMHRMMLYHGDRLLKTYTVSLGRGGMGPKRQQGDGLTPEGHYTIAGRNPDSKFHKALLISYPNEYDLRRAEALHVVAGGEIMIHGIRNGLGFVGRVQQLFDWTSGCIAVTDADIDEIWNLVPDGTPVEIRP